MKDLTKALIAAAVIGTGVATGGFGLMGAGAAGGAAGGAAAGGATAAGGAAATGAATGAGTAATGATAAGAGTAAGTAAATGAGTAAASSGGLASLMATPGFGPALIAGSSVFSTLFAPDTTAAGVYNVQMQAKSAADQNTLQAYQQANKGVQDAFESNKRNELANQQMLGSSLQRFFI